MARVINIRYDVEHDTLRDADGNALRSQDAPYIMFREKPLVNLLLVTDEDLTAYTQIGDAAETYSAALDFDFDHDTDVMAKAINADINKASEWLQDGGADTADPAAGQFSFYLSANTSRYQTVIAATGEKQNTRLELQAWDPNVLILAVRFDFRALNIMDDNGDAPSALIPYSEEFTDTAGKKCIRVMNTDGETCVIHTPPGGTGIEA